MSDSSQNLSHPEPSTATASLSPTINTPISDNNDDTVNKLFQETLQLNKDVGQAVDPATAGAADDSTTSDDEFSDAQQTTDASVDSCAADKDFDVDEASRRDFEQTLSEEQLNENQRKAVEIKDFGNLQFKNEEYKESLQSYTEGLDICPLRNSEQRAVLLGNRAAAHIQLGNRTAALQDCSKALELNPLYLKVLLRRAKLNEEDDKLDESLQDYTKALELNGDLPEARQAMLRLPPKIEERNEKLKTEMLGKLKDLGNMILRPFGLSTNNFQMKQDPSTGSYSVNFNQNNQ